MLIVASIVAAFGSLVIVESKVGTIVRFAWDCAAKVSRPPDARPNPKAARFRTWIRLE